MHDLPSMSGQSSIYLDHNATTPCASEVIDAMLPFLIEEFGNASSGHAMGRKAAHSVELARNMLARVIGADAKEVYFTSGATESNNIVLRGLTDVRPRRTRIVTTAIEHPSVLQPCRFLASQGFEVVELPATRGGVVDLDNALRIIDDNTLVVSIQGANNEIGTRQPVEVIARVAHERGAFVHCDATQLLGKVRFSVSIAGVDFASFSGHKAYGPKGIGALFVRSGSARSAIAPPYRGGSQEGRVRPGTMNVPGIVGFGEALRLVRDQSDDESNRLRVLRDTFEQMIECLVPDISTNGAEADRLPGTSSITIPGVPASMLIANTPDLCISDGAACSSGAFEPSHVLLAIGLSRDHAESTVRISFGRNSTIGHARQAVESIVSAVKTIRKRLRRVSV